MPRSLVFLIFLLLSSYQALAEDFQTCLIGLQEKARDKGLSPQTVAQVIPTMEQQQRVLELDRKQPEFVTTFGQYYRTRVNERRVTKGRDLYAQHRGFLDQLTRIYGVPGQYLIAFWGLETNFGGYLGKMPTLDSLATLACDPRRSRFFTSEFLAALQLMERESLTPELMQGSWAGAVGHTQFMPSSYLRHAVDGDQDGNINLWQSNKDALASGANLLKSMGWERNLRWGREVKLPPSFDYAQLATTKTLASWRDQDVQRADGLQLPALDIEATLLLPSGAQGPAFLVYKNFSVIMGWNRSESYALSVGRLADRIAGAGKLNTPPPADQQALTRVQMQSLQTALNELGLNAGEADGMFGPATRAALMAYQQQSGLIADGFPDFSVLERLVPPPNKGTE